MDPEVGVDRAGQELGAAEVDAYDASLDHAGHDTAPMADDDKPEYTVYRSRPRLPWQREESLGAGGDDDGRPPRRPRWPFRTRERDPRRKRRSTPGRIAAYLGIAIAGWLLLSFVVFLISAQVQSSKISDAADAKLSGGGYPLTSPNTILVLGSDARTKDRAEPGAQTIGAPSRSDSILLLRVGGGANAQLSILRDTVVDIPGLGQGKINAAYAFGGPSLAIETVESYLGIDINHLVEVNFENFPALIDSLGGVTVKTGCVISKINGGKRNGGTTLRLKRGEHELSGDEALALARTRKNECRPEEDDQTRVRRQQQLLSAIKDKVTSFETFVRLPWVSWAAPQAVRSDMSGPTLLGLVGAELTGGNAKRYVLRPSGSTTLPDGGAGLTVDDATKQRAVEQFLRG
jgi:LCP family protein required for cell wall assembly